MVWGRHMGRRPGMGLEAAASWVLALAARVPPAARRYHWLRLSAAASSSSGCARARASSCPCGCGGKGRPGLSQRRRHTPLSARSGHTGPAVGWAGGRRGVVEAGKHWRALNDSTSCQPHQIHSSSAARAAGTNHLPPGRQPHARAPLSRCQRRASRCSAPDLVAARPGWKATMALAAWGTGSSSGAADQLKPALRR